MTNLSRNTNFSSSFFYFWWRTYKKIELGYQKWIFYILKYFSEIICNKLVPKNWDVFWRPEIYVQHEIFLDLSLRASIGTVAGRSWWTRIKFEIQYFWKFTDPSPYPLKCFSLYIRRVKLRFFLFQCPIKEYQIYSIKY